MQDPGSWLPMQDPGSWMPMQDPGSRLPMQDPGSMGLIQGLGPWDPFGGGASGRPKADIMEVEARLIGGLGAKHPGIVFNK